MSNPDVLNLLILVGVPLAVIAIVFVLVYLPGARNAKRYRPGRPYDFAPVWFLARPEADGPRATHAELHGSQAKAELTTTEVPVVGVTGGASDRW